MRGLQTYVEMKIRSFIHTSCHRNFSIEHFLFAIEVVVVGNSPFRPSTSSAKILLLIVLSCLKLRHKYGLNSADNQFPYIKKCKRK